MDTEILYKVILFWLIFYISPGPVWVSVMEVTRKLNVAEIGRFFFRVFLLVNVTVQLSQAIICVIFVEIVSKYFSQIGLLLYMLGGLYISYLAYKIFKSKQSNSTLELGFMSLATIMLLSPKIWLLFPSGAVIANQLSDSMLSNALVFGLLMLIVSSLLFVFYVVLGKVGTRLLKDNFSYFSSGLLVLFALFLFYEAFNIIA